jgi:polyhydroxybutyrate depolymerase
VLLAAAAGTGAVASRNVPDANSCAAIGKTKTVARVNYKCAAKGKLLVWVKVAPKPATTTTSAPTAPATNAATGNYKTLVTRDGYTRRYIMIAPVGLDAQSPVPLLIALHGFTGSAAQFMSSARFETTTPKRTMIVAYPDGLGAESGLPQSWNAGGCCSGLRPDVIDDVAFIAQLIATISKSANIDPTRIWVAGHSNGAMMAYRVACELSATVTAVAGGAGALMVSTCAPTRPVSMIHVHGKADTTVPFAGGGDLVRFPPTISSVQAFATANKCAATQTAVDMTAARYERNFTCPSAADVRLVVDASWSHAWQPSWSATMLAFLFDHPRPKV